MSINTEMTALADAIRNKSGVTGKLSIAGMTTAVGNIVINPGGGETDLSFITATAGDILTGKIGSDKNGNPVYGTLEITGGDIDLSGVTVTADKMLAGIVAVGAGGNKVTGNIQTVAASSDGEYVTIPAGFHPTEQRFPITISGDGGYDTSTVTATADTMLEGVIAVGKSGETIVGNIKTVTPVVTETSVTIEPGYVAETLNFEIGGGSADGGESVVYGVINENGQFQPLDLSGDAPANSGEPEAVKLDVFNTGLGEPAYLPSGVGGTIDLVKVVSYTPAKAEWTEPEQLIITRKTPPADAGTIFEDIVDANGEPVVVHWGNMIQGVYEVTPDTANDIDESTKVFRNVQYPVMYIRHLAPYVSNNHTIGWAVTSDNCPELRLGYEYGWLHLCCVEGTEDNYEYIPLSNDMPWGFVSPTDGVTVAGGGATASYTFQYVEPIVHAAEPMRLIVERVTGFVDGRWQTSGERVEITEFTSEPVEGGVYLFDDSTLGADVSGCNMCVINSIEFEKPRISRPVGFTLEGLYSLVSETGYDYTQFNGVYGIANSEDDIVDPFKIVYKHLNRELYAWYAEGSDSYSSTMFFGPYVGKAVLEMSFDRPEGEPFGDNTLLTVVTGGVYDIYDVETGDSATIAINDVSWGLFNDSPTRVEIQYVTKDTKTGEWVLQPTDKYFTSKGVFYDELPIQNGIYAIVGHRFVGGLLVAQFPNAKQVSEQSILHLDFSRAEPLKDMSDRKHEVIPSDDIFRGTPYGWDMRDAYYLDIEAIGRDFLFGTEDFTWYALFYLTSEADQHIIGYNANSGMTINYRSGRLNVYASTLKGYQTLKMSDRLELNKWHSIYVVRKGGVLYSLVDIDLMGVQKIPPVVRNGERLELPISMYRPVVGYCYNVDVNGKPEEDGDGIRIGQSYGTPDNWHGKLNIIDISSGANPPVEVILGEV